MFRIIRAVHILRAGVFADFQVPLEDGCVIAAEAADF